MKEKQIGQFQYNPDIDYIIDYVDYKVKDQTTAATESLGREFTDKKITGLQLQQNQSYFLRFALHQNFSQQIVAVYIQNSKNPKIRKQNIQVCMVPALTKKNTKDLQLLSFEVVITPMNDCDEIVFELQRTYEDYQTEYGRTIQLQIQHIAKITNIITDNLTNVTKITKLGIQSSPGLLMDINGELIRVGRSGIYEMIYPITINFIGFILTKPIEPIPLNRTLKNNFFIMDYQYEQEVQDNEL